MKIESRRVPLPTLEMVKQKRPWVEIFYYFYSLGLYKRQADKLSVDIAPLYFEGFKEELYKEGLSLEGSLFNFDESLNKLTRVFRKQFSKNYFHIREMTLAPNLLIKDLSKYIKNNNLESRIILIDEKNISLELKMQEKDQILNFIYFWTVSFAEGFPCILKGSLENLATEESTSIFIKN